MMESLNFWHWGIGALVLMVAEMLLPGFSLLWLGIAAGLVALLLFLWPGLPFELQLLAFAVATLGSIVAWRAWRNRHPVTSDQPNLNERANHYIGRTYALDTAIVNGTGKVRVGDTVWKVAGEDLPARARVKVIGVEGMTLRVERAE
jgi:membrane protein implicated in regulation of membrane protease activity